MARKEVMKLMRTRGGTSKPPFQGMYGVIEIPAHAYSARLESKGSVPVCTDNHEVQLACLCEAARILGVTLETSDTEVIKTAKLYGARLKVEK